jgi:gamma-glutamylcyclotransferase (GGCT)/AIG2-like uncharacterized protein YtfP
MKKGFPMIERLFVYGSLGPVRPNAHVMRAIGGSWEAAIVTGKLRQAGWGAAMGYPGIDLNEHGHKVDGFLFTTKNLSSNREVLDAFEGKASERVLTKVKRNDGTTVDAYIYRLRTGYQTQRSDDF